jgi:hypothetical protein
VQNRNTYENRVQDTKPQLQQIITSKQRREPEMRQLHAVWGVRVPRESKERR